MSAEGKPYVVSTRLTAFERTMVEAVAARESVSIAELIKTILVTEVRHRLFETLAGEGA